MIWLLLLYICKRQIKRGNVWLDVTRLSSTDYARESNNTVCTARLRESKNTVFNSRVRESKNTVFTSRVRESNNTVFTIRVRESNNKEFTIRLRESSYTVYYQSEGMCDILQLVRKRKVCAYHCNNHCVCS